MRKASLILVIVVLVTGLAMLAGGRYMQQDNAYHVKRAQEIVSALQRLEIGKSDRAAADAIATKFGSAPPPDGFGGRYNKENCAALDRMDDCTYLISLNNSFLETMFLKHQFLPRLGVREWFGYAQIGLSGGTIARYPYWGWYKASNGYWRGVGAGMRTALPKYEPVQAHISDSYSVRRINMWRKDGFGLVSALTPTATDNERQRALGIKLGCPAEGGGCGEICEVMPEAWKDFYERIGHFDVENLGSTYLFCSQPPK